MKLNVLVACEESQTVCKAFRALGYTAFSCDLQKCSGGHPEWHVVGDCLAMLNGCCTFTTQDGREHEQPTRWDLLIAHPPCTYISNAGSRWMYPKAGELSEERFKLAMDAKSFFMRIYDADCEYIAVENPRPIKAIGLPKATTAIQPYMFGEPYKKLTYLWLKNLPPLMPTCILSHKQTFLPSNTGAKKRGLNTQLGVAHTAKDRSRTFEGVARAMAQQWSEFIEKDVRDDVEE